MKTVTEFFHCGDHLKRTLSADIAGVLAVLKNIQWAEHFRFRDENTDRVYEHQTGYNRAFSCEFERLGWETQPKLCHGPKLIGDFRKGLVFVEVQFGNASALYRDYYKFQYGLANGLLSLAVLIVPTAPVAFFPTRPQSVRNMADFRLAHKCFSMLPLNVPTMLVGLLPDNPQSELP